MSQSADPRRAAAALSTAALVVTSTTLTAPALGDTPPIGHATPLIAHTYPLHANTRDPAGTTRTSSTDRSLDATLAADIAFGRDSANLTPAATTALRQLTGRLDTAPPGTVAITGYTDNLGTHAHGLDLSRLRAQAVRAQLGDLTQLEVTVQGLAEADPVAPNTTEANRARNRRVEIHYQAGH